LGVQGQLEGVLRRGGRRARLYHHIRVHRAPLGDRDLEQLLALGQRQRPELGDPACAPEHLMTEVADAVTHQGAVGVPVDLITVGAAKRRVQRIADAAKRHPGPVPRLLRRCHATSRDHTKSLPPSTFTLAPVMYELRRDARKAMTGPISSGSPARGRCAGCPKCSSMADISAYGSVPSTPIESAHPTSASEAMLPGDTTFTRISSLASSSDRFFEMLVTIALAAV